jgi:hypothetical protein
VKSLIYTSFRSCYLNDVQTDSPAPPGFNPETKVCVMSLAKFERSFDRIAPSFLLFLGAIAAVATAGVGI